MTDTAPIYANQPIMGKKKKNFVPLVIIVVVILTVIGFFVYNRTKKPAQSNINVAPTETPAPTEEPKIDKKTVKFQVLNGTGAPGQASAVVEALEKAGYNSGNIKTDNKDKFDQAVTGISVKSGLEAVGDDVKKALGKIFDEMNIEPSKLDGDSEYDVVIVTGGKKYEAPTSSPAPSPTGPTSTPAPTETPTPTPTSTPTPTP